MAEKRHNGLENVEASLSDIGGSRMAEFCKERFQASFKDPGRQSRPLFPTAPLFDDSGHNIWRKITKSPEYYQTRDEIGLLEHQAPSVAQYMTNGTVLIDIGSGEARKIRPLLDAIEDKGIRMEYYALDLSKPALEETLRQLRPLYQHIECRALWGTFQDGWRWARSLIEHFPGKNVCYVSLGSFFGNDRMPAAVQRLVEWRDIMRPQDLMLLGMDAQDDPLAVWRSYHDGNGIFEEFMRNGLRASNLVCGEEWYRDVDWDICGVMDSGPPLQHRFVFRARRQVACSFVRGGVLQQGYEMDCFETFKYSPDAMRQQFRLSGLKEIASFQAPASPFYEYLLQRDGDGDVAAR